MKSHKPKYSLGNGEEANAEHPETFWIPDRPSREALKTGDTVKCIFQDQKGRSERMWVRITEALADGTYVGELDNHPTFIKAKAGDTVSFGPEHVIQIYPQTQKQTAAKN